MADEPRPCPPNRWVLLRWDLLVFAIAAVGFIVNLVWPYEISEAMLVVFGFAMLYVAYQIVQKKRAYDRAE